MCTVHYSKYFVRACTDKTTKPVLDLKTAHVNNFWHSYPISVCGLLAFSSELLIILALYELGFQGSYHTRWSTRNGESGYLPDLISWRQWWLADRIESYDFITFFACDLAFLYFDLLTNPFWQNFELCSTVRKSWTTCVLINLMHVNLNNVKDNEIFNSLFL